MGPRPDGRGKWYKTSTWPVASPRQWGRGQTAAESWPGPASRPPGARASMGPRPDGRGKLAPQPGSTWCRGVNGAAARRPRKARICQRHRTCSLASMGPRPDGRGKTLNSVWPVICPPRQWGRGQTAAESRAQGGTRRPGSRVNGAAARRPRKVFWPTSRFQLSLSVNGAAARRPRKDSRIYMPSVIMDRRQWGRGQTAAERARPGRAHLPPPKASMGPRPDGRGKASAAARVRPADVRQWGRGQTAAESGYSG